MAKVNSRALTQEFSFKSDRQSFDRPRNGRAGIVSQSGRQSRFTLAALYAQRAAETEPIYQALAQNTSSDPYTLALSDYLHAPVIHEVIRLPDRIRVDTTDNVLVIKVAITISDEAGQIVEKGEAKSMDDAWWEYITRTEGNITAEAFDLAGNAARYEG